MDEISNKTLAILLIAAIVVSLGGTLISLNRLAGIKMPTITGFFGADEEGIVQLDITSVIQVNFTTDEIDWGTGTVSAGKDFCELTSYEDTLRANCTDFTPVTQNLVLENIGNKNVTLNITMEKNAADFIYPSGSGCYWNVSELESGSAPGLELTPGEWQSCGTSDVVVCNETGGGFIADDSSDTLAFDFRVKIPSAASGSKSNVITASASQI